MPGQHTSRGLALLLYATTTLVVGCSGRGAVRFEEQPRGVVTEVSLFPSRVRAGEELEVSIVVHNRGESTLELDFASQQHFGIEIELEGESFASWPLRVSPALSHLSVGAGKSVSSDLRLQVGENGGQQNFRWAGEPGVLPPGIYRISGGVLGYRDAFKWGSATLVVTR